MATQAHLPSMIRRLCAHLLGSSFLWSALGPLIGLDAMAANQPLIRIGNCHTQVDNPSGLSAETKHTYEEFGAPSINRGRRGMRTPPDTLNVSQASAMLLYLRSLSQLLGRWIGPVCPARRSDVPCSACVVVAYHSYNSSQIIYSKQIFVFESEVWGHGGRFYPQLHPVDSDNRTVCRTKCMIGEPCEMHGSILPEVIRLSSLCLMPPACSKAPCLLPGPRCQSPSLGHVALAPPLDSLVPGSVVSSRQTCLHLHKLVPVRNAISLYWVKIPRKTAGK